MSETDVYDDGFKNEWRLHSITLQPFEFEVCVPKLVWNKTRQDETGGHFPNCRDRDETTYVRSCHRENPEKFPDFSPLKTNNTVPTQNKDYDGTGSG